MSQFELISAKERSIMGSGALAGMDRLARKMVLDWGMSDKLQHRALGTQRQSVFLGEEIGHPREYSEATAREIDEEVAKILNSAYTRAVSTLSTEDDTLEKLADALREKEVLDGQEVEKIVGKRKSREEKAS